MQADAVTAQPITLGSIVLPGAPALDHEMLRLWLIRALTIVVILIGVVLTFYILGTLGFAVYGLPRASFQRRPAMAPAA